MAEHLILPVSAAFAWPEPIHVGGADIAGEWVGQLVGTGTITLRSTARFFGDVQSNHLVIEEGAVFVGQARVGRDQKRSPRKSRSPSKANTAKRTRGEP
jgi:cytoskeletal protein CcmA (bactofilin family)